MSIAFFDIDGTLAEGIHVPASAEAALARMRANGHLAFICTGRPRAYAEKHFASYADGFVCNNGRLAFMGEKHLHDRALSADEVRELAAILDTQAAGYVFLEEWRGHYGGDPAYLPVAEQVWGPVMLSQGVDADTIHAFNFDIYFSDITWFNDCGSVMIELTSSGTNDKESNRYMKKVMRHLFETGVVKDQTNWWHFVLELDDPQGTANGQLDKSKFSYFRFYSVDPISTTPDYTMRIDNMQFTNNPTNYQPMVDEEEDNKAGSATAKAEVYVPKRSDPNLELTKQLKTLLTAEIVVAAVAVVALVFVIVYVIVSKKRKGKGV